MTICRSPGPSSAGASASPPQIDSAGAPGVNWRRIIFGSNRRELRHEMTRIPLACRRSGSNGSDALNGDLR